MPASQRRAVLYGRVSRVRAGTSTDGRSVDQQIAAMTRQAHAEHVTIVAVHRDDGVSASRYAASKVRAGWQQVMAAIADGGVTELWTWEISRATRDREVWAKLFTTCLAHDIKLNVGGKLHDPADDDDAFMLDLQAALAVKESARNSKRILRDVQARAAEGKPHGKVPFGFRRDYDPVTRALIAQVPDPATAAIVEEMARRVLAGESMYAIAADLNDRGIPCPEAVRARRNHGPDVDTSGMRWLSGEVRDQVLSPAAAGLRVHKGAVVAVATWPGIISAADHEQLKTALAGPGRPGWFGPAKHLLTGIAECGPCGERGQVVYLRRIKNRGYPSYACPGPLKRGDSCVARLQAPVDDMVTVFVVELLKDPHLLEQTARLLAGEEQRMSEAAVELANLRARLATFEASAASASGMEAASFGRVAASLTAQIEAAKARMGRSSGLLQIVLDAAGPDAKQTWVDHDDDILWQRQIVRALVRVVVNRSARGPGARGFDRSTVNISKR